MIRANIKNFKYEFIWKKNNAAQGFNARIMPLVYTENIAIFINSNKNRVFNKPYKTEEIPGDEHYNRWYAQQLFRHISRTRREIHNDLGHRKLEFYFNFVGKHFSLTSEKNYKELIKKYKINKWSGFVIYLKLKKSEMRKREEKE